VITPHPLVSQCQYYLWVQDAVNSIIIIIVNYPRRHWLGFLFKTAEFPPDQRTNLDMSSSNQNGVNVAVIGGGISGIVTAKELKDVGISCDVFEMMPVIGGAFAHYGYKDGQLTSSSVFTWFSDYPMQDRQKHLSWPEWLEYLNNYVQHFEIGNRFNFNCKVTEAKRSPRGGWELSIHQKNWSNGSWSHQTADPESVEEKTFSKHYDVLVIGSGLHNTPKVPTWDGQDAFMAAGCEIVHSSAFKAGEDFAGKKVVVVGSGESASDIAWLTSQHARKVHISYRTPPGTLFPRFVNGDTADIRDNRIIYSLPRAPAIINLVRAAHWNFYTNIVRKDDAAQRKVFEWAAKSNFENNNTIFTINACKSFGIPQAVVQNNAETHPAIARFDGRKVIFSDGTEVEEVDAVIAATGYAQKLPALTDKALAAEFEDPRRLWKHMAAPGVSDLFLLGFCRPQQINLITCCEMQARAMAQILSGEKQLPAREEMEEEIDRWEAHMGASFSRGSRALVDFLPFVDGLADYIGCAPDLRRLLFSDVVLWVYMMFAALQPSQWRLSGPGATPELARRTILASPLHQGRRDRVRRDTLVVFLLLLSTLLSFLALPHTNLVGHARQPFQLIAALFLAGCAALLATRPAALAPLLFLPLALLSGKILQVVFTSGPPRRARRGLKVE